jgi:hypothetical protein
MALYNVEKIYQNLCRERLANLINQVGLDFYLYKPEDTLQDQLYGDYAGTHTSNPDIHRGIISSLDFSFADLYTASNLQEAYLYTVEDIDTGSLIGLVRDTVQVKTFKVIAKEVIGNTLDILKRYKLTSIDE